MFYATFWDKLMMWLLGFLVWSLLLGSVMILAGGLLMTVLAIRDAI